MIGDGLMLLLDGTTAVPLTVETITAFLRDFPAEIGMHRFTEPMVHKTEGGYSGIVGIAESHLAIHAEGCLVWVDIFSCCYFAAEAATRAVVRLLGITRYRGTVIQRPMPLAEQGLSRWELSNASTFEPWTPGR